MSANAAGLESATRENGRESALRVLLIEDSPSDRRLLSAMLERAFRDALDLVTVDCLACGVKRIATRPFDLVLLDLGLPDSHGIETFSRLRASAPRVPIIVLTALDDQALATEAVRSGAQDFLVKGQVDANVLGRAVRYAMERHRAAEAYRALVRHSRHGLAIFQDERVVFANEALSAINGCSRDEILSLGPEQLLERLHPAERAVVRAASRKGAANPRVRRRAEIRVIHKDGSLRWLEVYTSRIEYRGAPAIQVACIDITERKQAEEEIQRLKAELERRVAERTAELTASTRELEAFCYSVSHELRSPLRSIDGFSQALHAEYAEVLDGQGLEYLERVRTGARRMGQLIDDILRLAGVSRGAMRRERVDLSAVARAVAAELQRDEPDRSVTFVVPDSIVAVGDAELLRIVVEQLLGNAWKYTGSHTTARIELGAGERNGQRVYFVRDDGVGFDMQYADKVFSPFHRLHLATEFAGAGTGLAIVERVVRRHGGHVWVDAAVEQGATFWFTLDGAPGESAAVS